MERERMERAMEMMSSSVRFPLCLMFFSCGQRTVGKGGANVDVSGEASWISRGKSTHLLAVAGGLLERPDDHRGGGGHKRHGRLDD